jgi:hypothetical protein
VKASVFLLVPQLRHILALNRGAAVLIDRHRSPRAAATLSKTIPAPQNLKFEREDWTVFRTVEGLQQKTGGAQDNLTRLVLKELADNPWTPKGPPTSRSHTSSDALFFHGARPPS